MRLAGRAGWTHRLDTAPPDQAGLGEQRGSVHERAPRRRVEVGGPARVDVEVAGGGLHSASGERPQRLVLQDVFVTMQVVNRVGRASLRLEAPEQRVEGESPHTGLKLPLAGNG